MEETPSSGGRIPHTTVSPVALPETLPKHVSDAMVTRFRAHLSAELRLLSSPFSTVSRHFRNSSESGYSATSSNENAKQPSTYFQKWSLVHDERSAALDA
jgi:hypothetical protein